jgi:hypothetical protein
MYLSIYKKAEANLPVSICATLPNVAGESRTHQEHLGEDFYNHFLKNSTLFACFSAV